MIRQKIKDLTEKHTLAFVLVHAAAFALPFVASLLLCKSKEELSGSFCFVMSFVMGCFSIFALRTWLSDHDIKLRPGKKPNNMYVLLGGLLPLLAIILVYLNLGVFPFGDRSVLIIDMHHQYVAFFASLREKTLGLLSGDSMLYSSHVGLGSGYLSLYSYYLSSPLNILILLFPRELLTEAIALITVLKIGLAGLTFAVFARGMTRRNDFSISVLSAAYALMMYMLAYSWDVMWLDSIILLPLIIYGLHIWLEKKNPALYIAALAGAIITNYYISFMICVFVVFYFIAHIIIHSEGWKVRDYVSRAIRFAVGSLLGGGISAFLLLPTAIYLQYTSGADDIFARDISTYFDLFDLFGRAMFSASPSIRGDSLPNIYCSVLTVLLIVIFFLCKAISLRKKIAYGMLLLTFVGFAAINYTYFLMHGKHFPNDLPHRFAFLISFAMLLMAVEVVAKLHAVTAKNIGTALFICIGGLALTEIIGNEEPTVTLIYTSLILFVVYSGILFLSARKKVRRSLSLVLLTIVVFIEIVSNGVVTITTMRDTEVYTMRSTFTEDYAIAEKSINYVESLNMPHYRTEILPRKTCNDPSLFGYSGLTVFASSNDQAVITLMGAMGYANNGVNSHMYHSFVPVADSILNLKYLIHSNNFLHSQLNGIATVEHEGELRHIYDNPYALSRAFVVDDAILTDWDYTSNNPFTVQNSFVTAAGDNDDVYTMHYPTVENAVPVNSSVSFDNTFFHVTPNGAGPASFTAVLPITATDLISGSDASYATEQYYVYVDCRAADSISISAGANSFSSSPNEPYIIDLGSLGAGDAVSVTIHTSMECVGNIFVASMNHEDFSDAMTELSENQLVISTYSESSFKGEINVFDAGVMFTSIPYDKGWKVTVDGVETETFKLGNALLGFNITEGAHSVKFEYTPSGLTAGIILSILCLLIFAALIVIYCMPDVRARITAKIPQLSFLDDLADPSVSLWRDKVPVLSADSGDSPAEGEGFSVLDDPALFDDDFDS